MKAVAIVMALWTKYLQTATHELYSNGGKVPPYQLPSEASKTILLKYELVWAKMYYSLCAHRWLQYPDSKQKNRHLTKPE